MRASLRTCDARHRYDPQKNDPAEAQNKSCVMERIAPNPAMITDRMHIGAVSPAQLSDRLTGLDNLLELSSMGIPDVQVDDWTLDITGLVNRPTSITFKELKRFPKRNLESVFVCSGDPRRPTTPLRRVANVKWGGVALSFLLDRMGVRPEATHLWSYGLDYGKFFGVPQSHYVKDMPLSRLKDDNVLIAYELNDQPLTQRHGFPARLVIPGFYGTNCVKWLCRLELRECRATNFRTTSVYSDPDFDADPSGEITKPVWEVAPESIFVAPKPGSRIKRNATQLWGWAWSSCSVRSVQVSTDADETWTEPYWSLLVGFHGSVSVISGSRQEMAPLICAAAPSMRTAGLNPLAPRVTLCIQRVWLLKIELNDSFAKPALACNPL
jgi:DMSO/TMAO reductase YedYZ molybdopterin-dependent catalytic subunit